MIIPSILDLGILEEAFTINLRQPTITDLIFDVVLHTVATPNPESWDGPVMKVKSSMGRTLSLGRRVQI